MTGTDGHGAAETVDFLSEGWLAAVQVRLAAWPESEVTLALICDYADWLGIVDGYDIGKAMTYHRLPISVGTALDLLKVVYFVYELLGVMAGVPAAYRSPVAA